MEEQILSVTQFNTMVREVLSEMRVWVQGEISGYNVSRGKWVTFDLKDEGSKVNCFMTVYQLDQVLEDGMEVKIYGAPSIYVPYGKYSFTVQKVEPVGEGALRRAFELTKTKLEEEGLFSPEYKKEIPKFPEKIGIITSEEAAAYTDFLRIVNNRWSGVEITLRPSLVQGVNAPDQLVDAINFFNKYHPVDVIVLTRGGGSLEDLQAFNSENVCRAVFGSNIPIVCGVGHERDTTLAELVSDQRASTPSNAAEIVVPDKQELLWQLGQMERQMQEILLSEIERYQWRLSEYTNRMDRIMQDKMQTFTQKEHALHLSFQQYKSQFVRYQEKISIMAKQLGGAMGDLHIQALNEVKQLDKLLNSYSPKNVLKRGYSIVRTEKGDVLTSVKDLKPGQAISTQLSDGSIWSTIDGKKPRAKQSTLL